MRILTIDPGKEGSNAYSLREDNKVLQYGRLKPISDMKDLQTGVVGYVHRIETLLKESNPDMVIIERFLDRGGTSKGTTGECISAMIALTANACPFGKFKTITSAQWKNWLTKKHEIGKKCKTKDIRSWLKKHEPIVYKNSVVHECDAIGMGLWFWENEILDNMQNTIGSMEIHKAIRKNFM